MKVSGHPSFRSSALRAVLAAATSTALLTNLMAGPATVIYSEDFNGKLPGWTTVRPAGAAYQDTEMLWVFNKLSDSFGEQSNQYTDSSTFSSTRVGVMLINDTVPPTSGYSFKARLSCADNDGFGLVWGYQGEYTAYRITFAQQVRAAGGWPAQGFWIDYMNNSQPIDIPTFSPNTTFVPSIGQPFDVTITITNTAMTLTVVDNPDVAPVTNTFGTDVTPITLPSVPTGKVGLFSWGMQGTIAPATFGSFRINNLSLSPTPLTNGTPAVLTNWSFLSPPGGVGTVNAANETVWGIAMDRNGERGTLIHIDDQAPNNTAPFTTNFVAPSAVSGDVTWSNYVYSARFILADNDGFGMLLRYLNPSNFYRLAFRQQAAQTGIKQGFTVQKNVNPTANPDGYEQVYSNGVAGFIPPYTLNTKQLFEVHASIRGNTMQVVAIKTPDGAATAVSSGPIAMDVTPPVVTNGMIGLFSWAQFGDAGTAIRTGTEVDWVKVSDVQGEGLMVSSPFGTPIPPVGLNDLPLSGSVTCSVDSVVNTAPGVRQLNNGWVGVGSVPTSGTTNYVEITLNSFSFINWRWITQYLLTTNANPGGTVTASQGPWINANATVTVTATPSPGYMFVGWSGSSVLVSNVLIFPMARPVNLTANFAPDSDGDGLPDPWELEFFGNTLQGPAGDPDGDGKSNITEYLLGTNPNYAEALLVTDGLTSQWTNTSRDTGLMGEITVVDFGGGYRGAFNNNNEFRYSDDTAFIPANNLSNNVSMQTHRMVVRSNAWNTTWGTNFCASWETSVGDNDGQCFYFRYLNESNWFRVFLGGQNPVGSINRPLTGLTVQRRTNGFHSDIPLTVIGGSSFAGIIDPLDGGGSPAGFKKIRVTVSATNQQIEIRAIGWNYSLTTPDFDPNFEYVVGFSNSSPSLQGGRIGFGNWGQGGFGADNPLNGIPIPNGGFFDNIVVHSPTTNDPVVFSENFETAMFGTNLPAGWENPYVNDPAYAGVWRVNVDGSISQLANAGQAGTGTATSPKADVDAPLLLAPDQVSRDYYLQVAFQQFDDDGVGVVYDFVDTNNFSRAIFRQEATFAGDIPPGLSVSRKSGGVWTDIVAGDPAFIFTPGRPFEMTLANNSGDYTLAVRDLDNLAAPIRKWHWTAPPAAQTNRFGITTWASQSAHLLYARAFALPHVPNPFSITNVTVTGGNVILNIAKQPGDKYHVLSSTAVNGPYVTNAVNQTAGQYSEPATTVGSVFYRLQYVP